jgi:hypothetical protein
MSKNTKHEKYALLPMFPKRFMIAKSPDLLSLIESFCRSEESWKKRKNVPHDNGIRSTEVVSHFEYKPRRHGMHESDSESIFCVSWQIKFKLGQYPKGLFSGD